MYNPLDIYWAYRNKITNKLWGMVHVPAKGKKKGAILISYITEPFTLAPWEKFSNFHTMYWECREIARLFAEKGYAVDAVSAENTAFIPKKPYAYCLDVEHGLSRLSKHLPANCIKLFRILNPHWKAYNDAEQIRLDRLEARRSVRLKPRRMRKPSQNAELADFLEGFGNRAVFGTFSRFNKPIFFVPISAVIEFDFPENKDFAAASKHFMWIGGGGAVLKGLDLCLEAFARMPNLHLHVCGPIYGEKDFTDEYKKELEDTPNIHVYGRIDVGGTQFAELIRKCGAVIYPSGGEGTSGAIIQAMHAGLVPIITHITGIQENAGYIQLEDDPTPESVARAAQDFAALPPDVIRDLSKRIWEYARKTYTREEFSKAYRRFIEEVLKL